MASVERELEEQLKEAGSRLLQPPASVDELLPLLDQVENFLSRVEQSPSKSMQTALSPSMKALVADQLLRHPDVDVQVAVASCISEITRITAPDAPYDDDRMKDIFKLIVSSFENLSDKSSRSYSKRTLILETVAKVRSCVVMLDLECDGLIVEMFQHFLRAIRDYHPENVFSSMETIMTLVLEESEDISLELISSVLASVKRDNQEFLPIAQKLGERVFENCAVKLKPYLMHAKKSLGLSLDNYSKVIASICDGATRPVGHNDDNACGGKMAEDSKLAGTSSGGADQADVDKLAEASPNDAAQDRVTKENLMETHIGGDNPDVDGSLKSVMSNGIAEAGNEDISADQKSSKEPEHAHQADQSADTNVASNAEPADLYSDKILESESEPVDLDGGKGLRSESKADGMDTGKMLKSEPKSEQTSKKRGRKQKPLNNASDFHQADQSADTNVSSNAEPGDLDTGKILESESNPYDLEGGKILKSEAKSEQTSKKRGRKHKSSSDATDAHQADQSADANVTSNAEPGDLDSGKILESESKPDNLDSGRILRSESNLDSGKILKSEAISEQTSKKRGRKQKSLNNSTEPPESSQIDRDKEAEIMADRSKEVHNSPYEEPAVEVPVPSENDNETAQPSSPKALESESMNVASPSPSGFVPDDGHPTKTGRPKKKGNLIRKDSPPAAVSKKASEGTNDSEAKSRRRKGKSAPAVSIIEVKNPVLADASGSEGGIKSDSDSKPLKQSGRKVDVTDDIGNGSSSKKIEDGRRRGRRKSTLEKDATKSSAKDDDKEMFSSPKAASKLAKHEGRSEATPTINSKRKRTPRKEEASDDNTKYGDNLVGLTIKVWWPEDQMFYEGVVDSFDPVKKKHTILYKDGDKEILVLKKERWEPVGGDSSNVEQAIENRSADPSPEMQKKKKAKTMSEPSVKQGKLESLRSGEASSSKSKGVATKSGRKSRDANNKIEGTAKDDTCKSSGKSEKVSVKSGRAAKTAGKSKGGDDGGTPKSTQDTPKTATKDSLKSFIKETPKTSKGKASKSAKKSKINGSGKMKSGSVNVKETKGMEKSPEAVKTPEGKSPDRSKLQETGTKSAKSGKKQRRS